MTDIQPGQNLNVGGLDALSGGPSQNVQFPGAQSAPDRPGFSAPGLGGLDTGSITGTAGPGAIGPLRLFPYIGNDLNAPSGYGPERIIALQRQLQDLGLLDSGTYQIGFWDSASKRAYENVVQFANTNGTSVDAALAYMKTVASRYGVTGGQQAKVAPLTIELTNPDSIANLAQELSARTLGHRLDPSEASRFADQYNQMEREYQTQRYNMQVSGRNNTAPAVAGEVAQPPSLTDYGTTIASGLKESHPAEASSQSTANAADAFFQLLHSSGGR
jgi:hypothetical protein